MKRADVQMLLILGVAVGGLYVIGKKLQAGTKRLAASERILIQGEETLGIDLEGIADTLEDKFGGGL